MTNLTMAMITNSSAPKNLTKGLPGFPILLKIAPITKANTITPKTFIPSRLLVNGLSITLDLKSAKQGKKLVVLKYE